MFQSFETDFIQKRGAFTANWINRATYNLNVSSILAYHGSIHQPNGNIINTGAIRVIPKSDKIITGVHGSSFHLNTYNTVNTSYYAPAVAGLAIAENRGNYIAQLSSTAPYTIDLDDAVVIVDATDVYTGDFMLDTTDTTVAGLPAGWTILSGAEGQTSTRLTLPAGGVGRIGLYVRPDAAALPPPAASYSFTVNVTAADDPALARSDSRAFVVPAVPFSQVKAAPSIVYSTPGGATRFDEQMMQWTTQRVLSAKRNDQYAAVLANTTSMMSGPSILPIAARHATRLRDG